MNIYILDRNLIVKDILRNEGDITTVSPFFNDKYIQDLNNCSETYEFGSFSNEHIEVGNYIAFQFDGKMKLFQIGDIEEEHEESYEITTYCEFAGIELKKEPLRVRSIPAANFKQYLENVLGDTGWKVGYIDDSITDVHSIEIVKNTKVLKDIQEKIKLYDCEIDYRVELKNGKVIGKYIDAYKRRGSDTKYRFEYSRNLKNVIRNSSSFDLVTALQGEGKEGLDFKSIEWKKSNGDPCDKPLNQDFVSDETSFELYNNDGSHLMDVFECDSESPAELLLFTYRELQNRKQPKCDYEVNVALLGDECRLGDEVYVIDNYFPNKTLHLSARIVELSVSFCDKTKNTCKFANYKEVKSNITDEMRNIKNQLYANANSNILGVSKGGFLSSDLVVDGFDINVKNQLVNDAGEEYFIDIRNKNAVDFIIEKPNSHTSVTQSFAIDFKNNHIYAIQLYGGNATGHLILTKTDMNFNILGRMDLMNFGHGGQIGLSYENDKTYIWTECDGVLASNGSMYGSKVCRFEFENGKTYTNHCGNVYNLLPNMSRFSISVNQETNRLAIRCMDSNDKYLMYIFDYSSVVNNSPVVIYNTYMPYDIHKSKQPNQGFSVVGNRLYYLTGFGYDQTGNKNNTKLHCFDIKGNKLYEELITYRLDMIHREPEGIYIHQISNSNHEVYVGFASDAQGDRKYNVCKYLTLASDEYENRGSFKHNNGHSSLVSECTISTKLDGSLKRKLYLMYVSNLTRFNSNDFKHFIVAEYKNKKWFKDEVSFEIDKNDAILADIIENSNGANLVLHTTNYNSVKGNDGIDAYTISLSNENHTFKCNNDGIISQTELEKFESIIKTYKGFDEVVSVIRKGNCVNCNIDINDNKISIISLDTLHEAATAEIIIEHNNQSILKTITFTTIKDGNDGNDANLLDWIEDWDGNFVTYGNDKIIAPKLFAGNLFNNKPTGVAIGKDVFGTGSDFTGIAGYNNGVKTFHIKDDGSATFGALLGKQLIIYPNGDVKLPKVYAEDIDVNALNGKVIVGSTIKSIDGNDSTIITGGYIESKGTVERSWLGNEEGLQTIILKSENGKFVAKNDSKGRSLFFSDQGISTTSDGKRDSSGVLDFYSNWYGYGNNGVALYSNNHVSLISNRGNINLSPEWENAGNNTFSFQVADSPSASLTDGLIYYGSHKNGYNVGLRFSKDPSDQTIYALFRDTDGNLNRGNKSCFDAGSMRANIFKPRNDTDNTYIGVGIDKYLRIMDYDKSYYQPVRAWAYYDNDNNIMATENYVIDQVSPKFTNGANGLSSNMLQVNDDVGSNANVYIKPKTSSNVIRCTVKGGTTTDYVRIEATDFIKGSDLIYKDNISEFDRPKMMSSDSSTYAIQKLKSAKVYEYDLIHSGQKDIGLLAQECPNEIVHETPFDITFDDLSLCNREKLLKERELDGDRSGAGINLGSMAAFLWKICQDQQSIIENLEKRITDIESLSR